MIIEGLVRDMAILIRESAISCGNGLGINKVGYRKLWHRFGKTLVVEFGLREVI